MLFCSQTFFSQSICHYRICLPPLISSAATTVAAGNEPTPRPYSVNVLIIDFVGNEEREKAAGGGGGCIEKAFKLASSNALLHASQLVISNEREREDRNDIHKFV